MKVCAFLSIPFWRFYGSKNLLYVIDVMILFFKSLPRMFKSASRDMRRHFSMCLSSSLSIAVALVMATVVCLCALTLDYMTTNIETSLQVQVSLSPTASDEQKQCVYGQLVSMEGVQSVTYSSKDEELEALIEENGAYFEQYRDSNPLYDVYLVDVTPADAMASVSSQASSLAGVIDVQDGGEQVEKMTHLFSLVRSASLVLSVLLSVLGIFLVQNTIRSSVRSRENEIAIMRTVGAHSYQIRIPFFLEGLSLGFWGALAPVLLIVLGYPALYHALGGVLVSGMLELIRPVPFIFYAGGIILIAGLLMGALGSWIATGRTVRRVR